MDKTLSDTVTRMLSRHTTKTAIERARKNTKWMETSNFPVRTMFWKTVHKLLIKGTRNEKAKVANQ